VGAQHAQLPRRRRGRVRATGLEGGRRHFPVRTVVLEALRLPALVLSFEIDRRAHHVIFAYQREGRWGSNRALAAIRVCTGARRSSRDARRARAEYSTTRTVDFTGPSPARRGRPRRG